MSHAGMDLGGGVGATIWWSSLAVPLSSGPLGSPTGRVPLWRHTVEDKEAIVETPLTAPLEGRIRLTIIALRISEGLYVLIGLCFPVLAISFPEVQEQYPIWIGICTVLLTVGFAVFVEIVVQSLKRRKFWAWVAGLCLSGLYIPSLFLPLGVMGLIGLLDPAARAAFGIGSSPPPTHDPSGHVPGDRSRP